MEAAFVISFSLFALVSAWLLNVISGVQSTPYMDEIFHIPQVLEYCRGNFSAWNPMITTLPGLYLTTVGILKPLLYLFQFSLEDFHCTICFRNINVLFSLGNFYVLYLLIKQLNPKIDATKACFIATILASFPVLYFFTFLYYTDVGSTFFTLLMYLWSLQKRHNLAAFVGGVAVMFRQTNIIWVVFVAGVATSRVVVQWMQVPKKARSKSNWMILKTFLQLTYQNLKKNHTKITRLIRLVLAELWSYIFVSLGFIGFVYWNNGVVVGDRKHHEVCLNFPQIFYFLMVTTFFAGPYFLSPFKLVGWMKYSLHYPFRLLLFLCAAALTVAKFTYTHEYLLADNRHYTFYIWAKIYRKHFLAKFLLIPFYWYSICQFYMNLKHKDIFWKIVFTVCILGAAVPQKLMEFRYFIVPYLILRLNMPLTSKWKLFLEFLISFTVNFFTICLFLYKPFLWPGSPEVQRFMW